MKTHLAKSNMILFSCRKDDVLAVRCLNALELEGYKTERLNPGENSAIGSIAFYTLSQEAWVWTSHNIRVAAHRLFPNRPPWAITTPFLVQIKPNPKNGGNNLEKAALELARIYNDWFLGRSLASVPWETLNGRHTQALDLLEDWFEHVAETIGEEELRELITTQERREKTIGRGGDIVFNRLMEKGAVLLGPDGIGDLDGNAVYQRISGFNSPVVSYGTSDIANVFELLQALKVGHVLGIPVCFETYPGAHDYMYWLNGFLNPSLEILGSKMSLHDLGFNANDKYTAVISSEMVRKVFPQIGLGNIAEEAASWADCTLWEFYHKAMKAVADEILSLLGISVPYHLTTFEEICKQTGMWDVKLKTVAKDVERKIGHRVVVLNLPSGVQLTSQSSLPDTTIGELHDGHAWLGGAPIYDLIFGLGAHGGVVVMVKDSTAGRVNLLAQNYISETSGLRLIPVGLFRLTAANQNEDWSIDPLVLLELLRRWGKDLATYVARQIWLAMEVPLKRENIGRKTIARVTEGGVDIQVVD